MQYFKCAIFDTNSTSGTIVNGKKIEKKFVLNDGDTIKFGKSEYIFYSTAVTTKQQIVPKTKNQPTARQQYRKNTTAAVSNKRQTNSRNTVKTTGKNTDRQRRPKSE